MAKAPARSSRSAAWVALARSVLTTRGIVHDPYARGMLGATHRMMATALSAPVLRRLGVNPTLAFLAARTMFFDHFVRTALDAGIDQVVVLGAGYDSRAWRMGRPGVTFFEVDRPETQAVKRSRAPSGGPTYVPCDVTSPTLADALRAAGLGPDRRAAFTAEGLTMYLTEPEVRRLLTVLAGCTAPGSRLAANFGVGFEDLPPSHGRLGRLARGAVAARGEPLRFRVPVGDPLSFVAESGWRLTDRCPAQELPSRYLGHTALARVPMSRSAVCVEAVRPGAVPPVGPQTEGDDGALNE